MADRVYPSAKPAAATGGAATNPPPPSAKAQIYGASRPAYRPKPPRHRRSCCCSLCLYLTVAALLLLLLAATAAAILFLLYRPHRPTFAVDSLTISTSNLTSKLNLTITARNPNKNLIFIYDPITVAVTNSAGAGAGAGTLPGFVHGTKNSTTFKTSVTGAGTGKPAGGVLAAAELKRGVSLKIELDTMVKVKMGGMRSRKVGIRVSCDGIKATAPAGKSVATANGKCEVDMRIKIWKWTF